ncbi:class I adenylate-forming enzyme family protein [Mycolicibacterium pyrenivorans]|uniref:class I adenylate-forming enzyme family protein n=1 Tax=Mycolicibacterium pyrenivorans TaxID=187102 RepID=UPI0021F32A1D|nr:AMP-binding protein [Mycolicibacterium pyrenivorans]MCV7154773.1 AMP-binding protein [Mycolicibacterium pyrenivorans]
MSAPQTSAKTVSYGKRLSDLADAHGDTTALTFVATTGEEREISWRELDQRSNRVARSLQKLGITQRDMVVIELPNSVEHVVCAFGSWKVGACVLPLRWDLPDRERERVLDVAQPAVVVGSRTGEDGGAQISVQTLEDLSVSADPVPDCIPDPARATASSGSTGIPKVIRAEGSGTFDLSSIENVVASTLEQGPQQLQLVPAPLYHTNGSGLTFTALLQGQSLILMEKFVAELALDLIERHRVNTLTATTIMLQRMARCGDITRRDLSSIESLLHGGAPLPQWLARFWIERIGPTKFFVAYGSSENAGTCFARGDEWLSHPGTVGRPVNTELRVRDDSGADLPPNETGMIYVRRPGQASPVFAYMGDVSGVVDADGYTALGDLGWLDDEGYLYLADRRVDMIISGGANVFPAEVEGALTEHPGVADAVVIGLPDDEWGERVHAIVAPANAPDAPSIEELRTFCRDRLAAYKVPKSIEFVDRLPRTDAGKIRRSDLANERRAVRDSE